MSRPIRLMMLAPGHFRAGLILRESIPGFHPRVYVYAPLDQDLLDFASIVSRFNRREDRPTQWKLDLRAGDDFLQRFLQEQPGNTVVISGKNRRKIDLILASVRNGVHVLADKPWVVDPDDFSKLEEVFQECDLREVIARDMMTERFDVSTQIQRELMRDPEIFGQPVSGTMDSPGLRIETTHYLRKQIAGESARRPVWWFDERECGSPVADAATHAVDRAIQLLFPNQALDYRRDVVVLDATGWATFLDPKQFAEVTGVSPDSDEALDLFPDGVLQYRGNGTISCVLRGVHVRITVTWDYEADGDLGDSHEAEATGTKARILAKHQTHDGEPTAEPYLYVAAMNSSHHRNLFGTLLQKCRDLQPHFPGLAALDRGDMIELSIPPALRNSYDRRMELVLREYAAYFHNPRQIPPWERSNLLAKYFVTTKAVAAAREKALRA